MNLILWLCYMVIYNVLLKVYYIILYVICSIKGYIIFLLTLLWEHNIFSLNFTEWHSSWHISYDLRFSDWLMLSKKYFISSNIYYNIGTLISLNILLWHLMYNLIIAYFSYKAGNIISNHMIIFKCGIAILTNIVINSQTYYVADIYYVDVCLVNVLLACVVQHKSYHY